MRTKDALTFSVSCRLFAEASGPNELLTLGEQRLAELLYPAAFYKRKAQQLRAIATILRDETDGKVVADRQFLLSLPGVGLKTAHLVLGLAFGIPSICVDIHVHRIANRRGWIKTRTAEESEQALRELLPEEWWIRLNTILVRFGQEICRPVSPYCRRCPLEKNCPRRGVTKFR